MKHAMALALGFALVVGAFAAPAPQGTASGTSSGTRKRAAAKTSEPSVSTQLGEMKRAIDAQQQQIQQLIHQVQSRDAVIQQLQQQVGQVQNAATQAAQKADTVASQSSQQQQDVAAVRSDVSDLKLNATNAALSLQETQKNIQSSLESPLAIHYKGISITPGGFLAAETVWRQHALASDVNTPFSSITFPGASQSHISEFFGSGRQSRISMLAEGKLGSAKVSGYVEADFLSAGVTSNNNQSNSYSLRQRQAWGQAALNNGWTFTGGQMWSLITETKKGVDNRSEALPMTIDAAYTAGFSWARQYGFRVSKNLLGNKAWLAFSVENPQETLGGHGSSTNFVLGQQGTSGGVYNPTTNYSFNATPDFVFKTAFEPGWGHYELFGLVTDFRDRIYPGATAVKPSSAGAFNNSELAGGIGANMRGTLYQHYDIGLHFLGGNGVGRYGAAGLTDAIARPDGALVPLRNYQLLGTLEYHSAKLDIYSNVGGEYEARDWFFNSSGKGVGYGSPLFNNSGCYTETLPAATSTTVTTPTGTASIPTPGSVGTPLTNGFNPGGLSNCNADTRNIIEGTIGFWYRFYSGPKGRVQWGPQYSYLVRNTWRGVGGNPSAQENMFFTSFRYYLP